MKNNLPKMKRVGRRTAPAAGPSLAAALPAEIDRELVLRAMRRTDLLIEQTEQALAHGRAKQLRRLRELELIEQRIHLQRHEAAA